MKNSCLIIVGFLMTVSAFAQSPNKMTYQAVIRNSSNTLVTNSPVGMRISIIQTTPSGTAVYVETQTPTTNANGLVSIEIGGGTVGSGNFSTIDWANGPYFVKTETDLTGGTSYTITGTSQLLSVPYALYAKTAGSIANTNDNDTSASNELQTLSIKNDTLFLTKGGFVKLPGGATGGNFTHYIGEQFGGGVIFHLWRDAQGAEHGLIVDKTDLSTSQVWSNVETTLIGPSAQSGWDGLSNSNAIVGQAGHTSSAAALCLNSTNGGQSDWYLPSIDELSLLWHCRFNVNKTLSAMGGATVLSYSGFYWSSSEFSTIAAWYFVFSVGNINFGSNKGIMNYVRAVRAF